MNYKKTVKTCKSSNGHTILHCYIYEPDFPPRAIVQLSHGMCEYVERYEDFISFLTGQGILVCGNDHLGHKGSLAPDGRLGYFAKKDGWRFLVRDLAIVTKKIKARFPDTPYFLLGHSMGSFVARLYLCEYGRYLDGAVILGTSGPYLPALPGILIISAIKRLKGEYHRSPFINHLLFGSYNSRIPDHSSDFSWLSGDAAVVAAYERDPFCNFLFTASAYLDLTKLLAKVSSPGWPRAVPKDLPLLLLSGEADPLGQYGRGIKRLYRSLQREGLTDVSHKLYPRFRHELLNETGKETVYRDILSWILLHSGRRRL